MITNETAKSTYIIADGVTSYAVGFLFNKNPDGTPQIKLYLNNHPELPLVYGTDYTLSGDELNVVLLDNYSVGDRLHILRNIPMVQLSDYVIGRIDPEQVETDFDESVMRDQQLKAEIDTLSELPIDHERRIVAIEEVIPEEATPSNKLTDKDYVDTQISNHTSRTDNPHSVTAAQVGLGNCDNTSDANKPVSTATQDALDLKVNTADLATVATSGLYSDLTGTPTIPTTLAELTGDVSITTPSEGEHLVYNGTSQKWENTPSAMSVSWGGITGDPKNQTDMLNISNWSSNVTNCITEIPQDIKLELNAGTLTLKAGSKVYVPNGVGVFDAVTISSDITNATTGADEKMFLCVYNNGVDLFSGYTTGGTVTERPVSPINYALYYNTTTNKVEFYNGSSWISDCSFPIALYTRGSLGATSIDQVFNGCGYIGSTVFALLDKGQIADGRNTDGTLKSTAISQTNVAILELQDISRADVAIFIKSDHTLQAWGRDGGNVVSLATKPAVAPITFCRAYIEDENLWYHSYATTDWEARDGTDEIVEICAVTTDANRRITDFRPKSVFRADMNNSITGISQIMNLLYPVGAIYIGTQGTCPLATLIPGSTWQQIQGRYLLASGTIAGTSEYAAVNTYIAAGLPDIGAYVQAARRGGDQTSSGAFYWGGSASAKAGDSGGNVSWSDSLTFWASRYNSVYGSSTTNRPAAYVVNVWVRTA